MNVQKMGYVTEPEKQIPVVHDVDVAVVGAGTSGLFAALGAGTMGAKTVLIDRFGMLGGNIGPGYFIGGGVGKDHAQTQESLHHDLPSIPLEFLTRVEALISTANYADLANVSSYVGHKMAKEASVELVLSAYASDPIMEEDQVKGIFVECKTGRVAIKAKVVIDATGDAGIAQRAGAPMITHVSKDYASYGNLLKNEHEDFECYDETGLFYLIGDACFERYQDFLKRAPAITEDDRRWADTHLAGPKADVFADPVIPLMRKAWEEGTYRAVRNLGNPNITISCNQKIQKYGECLVGGRAAIAAGQIDMSDFYCVSLLEKELRVHAFDTVRFLRAHVPGFEKSYLLFISPFMGSRAGPCIQGEHTFTVEDRAKGRRFDDVIFQNFVKSKPAKKGFDDWIKTGCDIPYRMILPKGIDGLMVIGRGAAYIQRGHDGAGMMRRRPIMMTLGQAAGTAAACCVNHDCTPFKLDVRILQKELIRQGFFVANKDRLIRWGLI